MKPDTICIQGGWKPKNGEPRQLPIYQSTTWRYATSEEMGKLFDLEASGYFYTRLQNPTNDVVADKIRELNSDALPVIVTGDFNMEASNAFLSPMKEGFQNARSAAVVTDDHFSYNGWGKAHDTIDYVWFEGFTCTRFETVTKPYYERTFISDHFPVKAVLVF